MSAPEYHVSVWRTAQPVQPDVAHIEKTLRESGDTLLEDIGLVARLASWNTGRYRPDVLEALVADDHAVGAIGGGVSALAARASDVVPRLVEDSRVVANNIWLVYHPGNTRSIAEEECAPDEWLVFLVSEGS